MVIATHQEEYCLILYLLMHPIPLIIEILSHQLSRHLIGTFLKEEQEEQQDMKEVIMKETMNMIVVESMIETEKIEKEKEKESSGIEDIMTVTVKGKGKGKGKGKEIDQEITVVMRGRGRG